VPRWLGDVNFMPLMAETKVISEHLTETYDRLKKGFAGRTVHLPRRHKGQDQDADSHHQGTKTPRGKGRSRPTGDRSAAS
jgi:hypothetical protein